MYHKPDPETKALRQAARGKELENFYLKKKGSPDPQQRAEADTWFKNRTLLLQDRPAVLHVVYEYFAQLADIALGTQLERGILTLTSDMLSRLERFAVDQCFVDPAMARRFAEDYLQKRGLKVGHPLDASPPDPKQPSAADVIDMFRDLDLRVTDDSVQIGVHIRDLTPNYRRMAESQDPTQRDKAILWFKSVERLQGKDSRTALLAVVWSFFLQLADVALSEARGWGIEKLGSVFYTRLGRHAQRECHCDPPLARRFTDDYLQRQGIPKPQPSVILPPGAIPDNLTSGETPSYDQVCIQGFLAELDLDELEHFCFVLHQELGPRYVFERLAGTPLQKSMALVRKAAQNDELGELVFQIAQYWIKGSNQPRVLDQRGLGIQLGIYLRQLWNKEDQQEKSSEVLELLRRIHNLPKEASS